uniref:Uncharacterized protein n=2 Tax=Noccaea caerulescens TaxID=107243 RepID=A0A1J3CAP3_NOCCA
MSCCPKPFHFSIKYTEACLRQSLEGMKCMCCSKQGMEQSLDKHISRFKDRFRSLLGICSTLRNLNPRNQVLDMKHMFH